MGQTADCTATFKRQTSTGRAEIETDYVLFRGDFRVKLLFSSITGVAAANGFLTLKSTEGTLTLSLGPQAGKWAARIQSPKTRAEKIGVKAGQRVSVLGLSDRAFMAELKDAGADVSPRARKESDVIFAAIESAGDLDRFAALRPSLRTERGDLGDSSQRRPRGIRGADDGRRQGRRIGGREGRSIFGDTHGGEIRRSAGEAPTVVRSPWTVVRSAFVRVPREPDPGRRISLEVELNHHGRLVADDPPVMSRGDGQHRRR